VEKSLQDLTHLLHCRIKLLEKFSEHLQQILWKREGDRTHQDSELCRQTESRKKKVDKEKRRGLSRASIWEKIDGKWKDVEKRGRMTDLWKSWRG